MLPRRREDREGSIGSGREDRSPLPSSRKPRRGDREGSIGSGREDRSPLPSSRKPRREDREGSIGSGREDRSPLPSSRKPRRGDREGSIGSGREDRSPLPSSRTPRRRRNSGTAEESGRLNENERRASTRHLSKANRGKGERMGGGPAGRIRSEDKDIHSILNGLPKAISRGGRNMSVEPQGLLPKQVADEQIERGKDVLRLLRRVQQDSQRLCFTNARHGQILPELLVSLFDKEIEEMKELYQQSHSHKDLISSDLRACHDSLRNLVKSVRSLVRKGCSWDEMLDSLDLSESAKRVKRLAKKLEFAISKGSFRATSMPPQRRVSREMESDDYQDNSIDSAASSKPLRMDNKRRSQRRGRQATLSGDLPGDQYLQDLKRDKSEDLYESLAKYKSPGRESSSDMDQGGLHFDLSEGSKARERARPRPNGGVGPRRKMELPSQLQRSDDSSGGHTPPIPDLFSNPLFLAHTPQMPARKVRGRRGSSEPPLPASGFDGLPSETPKSAKNGRRRTGASSASRRSEPPESRAPMSSKASNLYTVRGLLVGSNPRLEEYAVRGQFVFKFPNGDCLVCQQEDSNGGRVRRYA